MDNRTLTVTMKPRNRKRVVVVTDLVTGGVKGWNPNTDHFSVLKGLAKAGAGIKKAFTGKEGDKKIDAKLQKQLQDIDSKKALKVLDKVATIGTGAAAGLGLAKGIKAATAPKTVKSLTPDISPIKPSVPETASDEGVKKLLGGPPQDKGIGRGLVDIANKIPKDVQDKIKKKAQTLIEEGTAVKTPAQVELENRTLEILPKTKEIKDAEEILTAPRFGGKRSGAASAASAVSSGIDFKSPYVIGAAVLIFVAIITAVIMKK